MARGRRSSHRPSGTRIRAQPSPHWQSSKLMALDPLWLLPPALTLASSFDNFQVPLRDATNKGYQELLTGSIEVFICYPYMFVKFYEFVANLLRLRTFRSWIQFPTWPPNVQIFRDTAVAVIISYVVLLDINLSNLWLAIFPVMAIAFIYALYVEFCRTGRTESSEDKTTKIPVEFELIEMMPFGALLLMDQLDDHAADRFPISQFLLFLSSTLAALTRMMMRLPTGASPGIAPASELLHKTLLLLLLVTAHTVAAEALGEGVVLICMPEVVPVLLWFSVNLDRRSSVISSVDELKTYRKGLTVLGAVVALLFAYLKTSMDGSLLSSWCTKILVSCGVSGILAYYVVVMLRQWPGQQAGKDVASDMGEASGSLEEAVQSKKQADSLEKSVHLQLLKFWANALMIVAAALLVLKFLVAVLLGPKEPLVDALYPILQRLYNLAAKGQTKTFWSISLVACSALYNLYGARTLHRDSPERKRTLLMCSIFGFYVFLILYMYLFTNEVFHTVQKYNSRL